MQENTQNSSREEISTISNSRALFLTQDGTFSPVKKKTSEVKILANEEEKGELWEMNKHCDFLIEEVSQLKTQEVLSLYRQINRNFSQNSIEKEGELNKLEKVSKIDIDFLRKKIENEPQIDFNFFNQRINAYEEEASEINELVQDYKERVERIEKEFW